VPVALRYAARSDVGLVRKNNQDSGYAGPHLLVVADGMGGHAGGDVASSLAVGELAPLDSESPGPDAMNRLRDAILEAHQELLSRVDSEPELTGMGTTVTALLRTGGRLALAHIGDSRAYLLRESELVQITKDHTFVQTLVDDGRLTLEEAEHHPQRSVLMRVLSDVVDDVEPDLSIREARLGDRYLLCSDGLSGVVSFDTLQDTLAAGGDPDSTCETLVALALRAGAPDNVTCIVIDVVESAQGTSTGPVIVGSASLRSDLRVSAERKSSAERAADLTALTAVVAPAEPAATEVTALQPRPRRIVRLATRAVSTAAALAIISSGAWSADRWMKTQYYLAEADGYIAVYQGLPTTIGPVKLSRITQKSRLQVKDLPSPDQSSLSEKAIIGPHQVVSAKLVDLAQDIDRCRILASASAQARASASATATPSVGAKPSSSAAVAGASSLASAVVAKTGPVSNSGSVAGASTGSNPKVSPSAPLSTKTGDTATPVPAASSVSTSATSATTTSNTSPSPAASGSPSSTATELVSGCPGAPS